MVFFKGTSARDGLHLRCLISQYLVVSLPVLRKVLSFRAKKQCCRSASRCPDPCFYFDADPDPTLYFNADLDPDPARHHE